MKTRRPGGASTSPSSHKLLDWCLSGDETRNHRAPHVCTVFVKLSLRLSFPSLFSQRINPRRMYNQCNRVRCPGGGERHARLLWPCRPRLPFGAELRPLWCPAWQGRRPRRDHRLLLVVSVGVGLHVISSSIPSAIFSFFLPRWSLHCCVSRRSRRRWHTVTCREEMEPRGFLSAVGSVAIAQPSMVSDRSVLDPRSHRER